MALNCPRPCIIKSTFNLLFQVRTLSRTTDEIDFLFEIKEKKRGTTVDFFLFFFFLTKKYVVCCNYWEGNPSFSVNKPSPYGPTTATCNFAFKPSLVKKIVESRHASLWIKGVFGSIYKFVLLKTKNSLRQKNLYLLFFTTHENAFGCKFFLIFW